MPIQTGLCLTVPSVVGKQIELHMTLPGVLRKQTEHRLTYMGVLRKHTRQQVYIHSSIPYLFYIYLEHPLFRVLQAKQFAYRHLYYRHDFKALSSKLRKYYTLTEIWFAWRNIDRDSKYPSRFDIIATSYYGGGVKTVKKRTWSVDELTKYTTDNLEDVQYHFVNYTPADNLPLPDRAYANIPLDILIDRLSVEQLKLVCNAHGIRMWTVKRMSLDAMRKLVTDHQIEGCACNTFHSVFEYKGKRMPIPASERMVNLRKRSEAYRMHDQNRKRRDIKFPPQPPSKALQEQIVRDYCSDCEPANLEEAGCCICGQLKLKKRMMLFADAQVDVDVLQIPEVTRDIRKGNVDPITYCKGPVIDPNCSSVCLSCINSLKDKVVPVESLANGLWIGQVPDELSDLSWTEKLLIARVSHNHFVVRVASSGMHKLKANAICHSLPTPKIYSVLPPPREDLDEVLAFIFIGPNPPTPEDYQRTPFLVRRNKVARALRWLKLNHVDYADIEISQKHLNEYNDISPPVYVLYQPSGNDSIKIAEATAVDNHDDDEATSEGQCSFQVHGLSGEELSEWMKDNPKKIRAKALQHFRKDGNVLAIGHAENPESLYNNPQLYPQMFPWLFPYGLGGIGNTRGLKMLGDDRHKRWLLMYHDKRFQLDPVFPLMAWNHQQIKNSVTGGYLLAQKQVFDQITKRLLNLDDDVLGTIIERMETDGHMVPNTPAERECFRILNDLDFVNAKVKGSTTSRRYMRNEIWAMIASLGAPSWFITFSPADIKHPIALYFADTKETFSPSFRDYNERLRLIANNPVAGARFFHFVVTLFIKHVLGYGSNHSGLYGDTAGYYGTVEQQGRLTLHMHMLIWIRNSLTPQEIRDMILDPNSTFQQKIIEYLESVHIGEFMTGTMSDIESRIDKKRETKSYIPSTDAMPEPPPTNICNTDCNICKNCKERASWWNNFCEIVDELVYYSNRHQCHKGCLNNKYGTCKARFPRSLFELTTVDPLSGAINMKKGEMWLNFFTPLWTFLSRCNTDATSLLSGTAIKSVVAYVTDYITKMPLKTHTVFQAIRTVFSKLNSDMNDKDDRTRARTGFIKIVNALTARSEIGGPMAVLYLLNNPDHYTSHRFITCYWYQYLQEVLKAWPQHDIGDHPILPEKVVLAKNQKQYIGLSPIYDYIFRPAFYESVSLYDWIARAEKVVVKRKTDQEESEEVLTQSHDNTRVSYMFMKDHPRHKTQSVYLIPENKAKIPNFVGGILPRQDKGNREEYCTVMLMLFKPWRSGHDLKSQNELWDDAFNNYVFTERQSDIMKFMHIRYECNDARDDYSALRKSGLVNIAMPCGIGADLQDELDLEGLHGINIVDNIIPEYAEDDENEVTSSLTMLKDQQMRQAANMIHTAGGAIIPLAQDQESAIGIEFETGGSLSGHGWKSILTSHKEAILNAKDIQAIQRQKNINSVNKEADEVKIISQSYFSKHFRATDQSNQDMIDKIVVDFTLNTEQERAFRIIANHAVQPSGEQLKLYLGGMAGTGKSQVIKALIEFFAIRNESYRFTCIAPTGAAASLINGSTYHSMLQLGQFSSDSQQNLSKVHNRLKQVEYIFFDEISMVDCRSFYNICAKMCKAVANNGDPFGGINMICAGDFAQLPPVSGNPLYSQTVNSVIHTTNSYALQEAAIGKAVWHQFTFVVMLRQNMRQKTQSIKDAKFRKALENMRYKSCTSDDIAFLRTLTVKPNTSRSLTNPIFRNISVITAFNSYRDKINDLGCERFAAETGQRLMTFYSVDKWSSKKSEKKIKLQPNDPLRQSDIIPPNLQQKLWELPAANCEHRAGTLKLCLGMPVMIKNNEATECGVTNGAEGIVVGWKAKVITGNKYSLDVVFVKLTSPPNPITLDGLSENVVPIAHQSQAVSCEMRNGTKYRIARDQVAILPNFAMTDYNSQGRTRSYNVVDLQNCRTHQSVYTCLSRSSSVEGTLIIQGFDPQKVTGGLSGYLRQEFRELEMLDEITLLRYNNQLDSSVSAGTRTALIHSFRVWKGENFVPKNTHMSIRWTCNDPLQLRELTDDIEFTIINKNNNSQNTTEHKQTQLYIQRSILESYVPAKGSKALNLMSSDPGRKRGAKRINIIAVVDSSNAAEKQGEIESANAIPGFQWNSSLSCAYDSLWTILLSVRIKNREYWDNYIQYENTSLETFTKLIQRVDKDQHTLEVARDKLREYFHIINPLYFPILATTNGTSISNLCAEMFKQSEAIMTYNIECRKCDIVYDTSDASSVLWDCTKEIWKSSPYKSGSIKYSNLQKWIPVLLCQNTHHRCLNCNRYMQRNIIYDIFPNFIAFDVYDVSLNVETRVNIQDTSYRLCGIIYHGNFHFTARILSENDEVWYYDGMSNQGWCENEGIYSEISATSIRKVKGRRMTILIYLKM